MMQPLLNKQRGLATVEFAIVGLVALLVLFAAMEIARLMFTVNMLQEATRRGARVATVCAVDSPAIARATVFNATGSGTQSPFLPKLTTANVQVDYLNIAGNPVTGYAADVAAYVSIEFVRVQIVNYEHELIIPGLDITVQTKAYPTVLPRESLGIWTDGSTNRTSTCT